MFAATFWGKPEQCHWEFAVAQAKTGGLLYFYCENRLLRYVHIYIPGCALLEPCYWNYWYYNTNIQEKIF